MKKHKVGIVGCGFCGTALSVGLEAVSDIREYDKYKDTESLYDVVSSSDIIFVCVPTPMHAETGRCDTSIVEEVCLNIASVAKKQKSIVIKSTVPPGTTQKIADKLDGHSVLFSPEFLTEKNFIDDFLNQDRILVGATTQCTDAGVAKVLNLFEDFINLQSKPALLGELSSAAAAEMVKYVGNCFLATKVIFFNEMKEICDALNIDFEEVSGAATMDERIGCSHYSVPGPDGELGYGGKCFPKDTSALIALARDNDVEPILLDTVWSKNLLVRKKYDWEDIIGATTDNLHR